MRTKSLALAAAALVGGLLTASAQSNVYSLNIVGYVNVPTTNGFNLVANSLDLDGTGTNNTFASVFGASMPNLSKVYAFNSGAGTYASSTYLASTTNWTTTAGTTPALQPGSGFWLQIPAAAAAPTLTLVGNVLMGTNSTPIISGYQILGSKLPMGGGIQTVLGYAPDNLDKTFQYDSTTGTYSSHTYLSGSGTWTLGEPTVKVGEGFWMVGHAGSAWTQILTP